MEDKRPDIELDGQDHRQSWMQLKGEAEFLFSAYGIQPLEMVAILTNGIQWFFTSRRIVKGKICWQFVQPKDMEQLYILWSHALCIADTLVDLVQNIDVTDKLKLISIKEEYDSDADSDSVDGDNRDEEEEFATKVTETITSSLSLPGKYSANSIGGSDYTNSKCTKGDKENSNDDNVMLYYEDENFIVPLEYQYLNNRNLYSIR